MRSLSGEHRSFARKLWREFAGSERKRLKDSASAGMHLQQPKQCRERPRLMRLHRRLAAGRMGASAGRKPQFAW